MEGKRKDGEGRRRKGKGKKGRRRERWCRKDNCNGGTGNCQLEREGNRRKANEDDEEEESGVSCGGYWNCLSDSFRGEVDFAQQSQCDDELLKAKKM
jgi:hypothetical protein